MADEGMMEGIADEVADPVPGIADDGGESDVKTDTGGNEGSSDGNDSGKGIADGSGEENNKKTEPEPYELSVDESFPIPEENLKSFSAKCRELGLSKEQAEGLLGWHREQYEQDTAFAGQQEKAVLDGWAKEIADDKDFGGGNMKQTVAEARKALAVFDRDGSLRQMLRETKYQYNPSVIRVIASVGRALGEHTFVGQNGEGGSREIPLEDRMYPNMKV